MEILDVHSYFSEDHPLRDPCAIHYLLAPPMAPAGARLEGFRAEVERLAPGRVAGGLLPVLGTDAGAFAAALEVPFWRGLLLSPVYGGGSMDAPEVLARLAHPLALTRPVVIEAGVEGFSRPTHLEQLLTSLPTDDPRPVVLTHGGQLNISGGHLSAAAELFQRFPRTCLETSGIYRQDFLEEMLLALGPERILYGSGHPWMDERLELERVRILPTDPAGLEAMLGGNARRLFGIDRGRSGETETFRDEVMRTTSRDG